MIRTRELPPSPFADLTRNEAETILAELAEVFFQQYPQEIEPVASRVGTASSDPTKGTLETHYRTLVEQIPAVVFMAYMDRAIGEAYVSPRIEETLGFTQAEWLEDPVRWYHQIHVDDQQRWSLEAAEMFLTGRPLRSSYRVIARDGHVVWFHCEAKMVRREDGRPWFIHGIGFDITDLKLSEAALQEERNLMSAILDTVGALVVVLDPAGRIVRFNRACEQISGYASDEVEGRFVWELFTQPDEARRFREIVNRLRGPSRMTFESSWLTRNGDVRHIAWSGTSMQGSSMVRSYIVTTGIDITERKRMEKTVLEISAREQRQIGQDLHDGLGQQLTGIAFLSKVLQQKLETRSLAEAADAARIVGFVNEAINRTRELARGLLPVVSDADGLMSSLDRLAREVHDLFGVSCEFACRRPVLVGNVDAATHLYYIAQEAVHNAIRHAQPRRIVLTLERSADAGSLAIEDDGIGIPENVNGRGGLGLSIMTYRASMIGGALDVRPREARGTTVCCQFPLHEEMMEQ